MLYSEVLWKMTLKVLRSFFLSPFYLSTVFVSMILGLVDEMRNSIAYLFSVELKPKFHGGFIDDLKTRKCIFLSRGVGVWDFVLWGILFSFGKWSGGVVTVPPHPSY